MFRESAKNLGLHIFWLGLLVLLHCPSAAAALTVVQHETTGTSALGGNTLTITLNQATGSGNLLVVGEMNDDSMLVSGVSDGTNNFTQIPNVQAVDNVMYTDMWYLPLSTAGKTTITVTFSGTVNDFATMEVWEVSGFASPAVDVSMALSNGVQSGGFATGPVVTTTTTKEFIAALDQSSATVSQNPKTGNEFTSGGDIDTGNNGYCSLITTVAGAHQPAWKDNGASFESSVAAFRESECSGSVSGLPGWVTYCSNQQAVAYCDNNGNWQNTQGSSIGACSSSDKGKITYNSNVIAFCNGTNLYAMKAGSSLGGCSTNGQFTWNSAGNVLQGCMGGTLYAMNGAQAAITCGTGYQYRRPVTINYPYVPVAPVTVTYTANSNWVVPAGVTSVLVEAWGGGGAGAGQTVNGGGGGGGGGAYAASTLTVNPGDTHTIVVGAQRAGGTGIGGNGNNSTFDTTTVAAAGGTGGTSSGTGGAGGSIAASTGTTVNAGGNGGAGGAAGTAGGGGGGAGGSNGNGNNGTDAAGTTGGTGGTAGTGGGKGGNGRNATEGNGSAGTAPGGGGGGAFRTTTNHNGGAGARGQVKLTFTPSLTNFPMLITGTYNYLATTGNGGNVTNASGYDIIFTSDAPGSNKLNYERESWNAATGAVKFWVQVPSISGVANTVIYMWYGNSAINSDQSNGTGTWDSFYQGVWHMDDNAANTTIADSTANGNNWTNQANTSTQSTSGQIGAALAYNGTSNYASVPINLSSTSQVTSSFWINRTYGTTDSTLQEYSANFNSNITTFGLFPDDATDCGAAGEFMIGINGNNGYNQPCYDQPSSGAWHYFTVVYDLTQPLASQVTLYIDGVLQPNVGFVNENLDSGQFGNYTLYMGARGGTTQFSNGTIDEARISTTARQADWVQTEYNNQSSPSTFYSIGATN